MDIANLAPEIAKLIGISPSTMLLLLLVITTLANRAARLIPNDATGFWGGVRILCAIVGVHVSSRVASGVTVEQVARAALDTPPIPEKVVAEAAERITGGYQPTTSDAGPPPTGGSGGTGGRALLMLMLAAPLALMLAGCGATTGAARAHLHTAGEVVCDHRLELRSATALIDPRPSWVDQAEASLDWLCALLGFD